MKGSKNEGKRYRYLLRSQALRTTWTLVRNGASKVVPIGELRLLSDGEIIDVPGKPRVIHTPGHTAGSSAFIFEDRDVIFTGDALVTEDPLTGLSGPQIMPAALNQDTGQAMRSLRALEGVRAHTVLPGHGEPWTAGLDGAIAMARQAHHASSRHGAETEDRRL